MVGVANLRVDNVAFPTHTFVARDAAGAEIDPYNLNNFRLTTLSDDPIDGVAQMKGAYADLKRDFDLGSMPLTVKLGTRVYEESKDNRRATRSWTFVGADGIANTADDNARPYMDTNYSGEDPYWGSRPIQWIDAYKLAETLKTNPNYFLENAVTSEQFRINNSEKITETITAYYLQLEGKLLNNKLSFVTGVRYEKTEDAGEGVLNDPDAAFQRNANGTFVDSTERGSRPVRSYDDYYPSLNVTYNVTDNLLVRVGYAKTMGRPDYTNILPFTTIDDNENFDFDPTASPGSLTIRNTGLQPWSADNYDLSLEYYFKKSGYLSAGIFQKEISNFFQSQGGTVTAGLAEQLGIGPEFIGWGVSTLVNGSGTAKIRGYEFSANRQLDFLPSYLRYLSVNTNATKLELSGASAAAFNGFIDTTANLSISWNKAPVRANVNFNYRGRQQRGAQTGAQYGAGNGFYEYYAPRTNVDVNVEYTLSKRFKFFANARNIFNKPQVLQRYSETNPSASYAVNYQQEEFGIQFAVGVKGTF
jgi:TonB-dependent receptor